MKLTNYIGQLMTAPKSWDTGHWIDGHFKYLEGGLSWASGRRKKMHFPRELRTHTGQTLKRRPTYASVTVWGTVRARRTNVTVAKMSSETEVRKLALGSNLVCNPFWFLLQVY